MKRRYMWMGVVVVVLALGASVVHARGNREGRRHFTGPRLEALDLTQVQKDQLKSMRTESRKEMIQLKANVQLARLELKEVLSKKDPGQRAVDQAVTKVSSAHAKMMKNRVQQKVALNKILTEEQFQKLDEMPKGRQHGPRGMHGRRGDHRGSHGKGMGSDAPSEPQMKGHGRI